MRSTGYSAFSNFLEQIGVDRGSTLMVHSFMPSLGVLTDGMEGIYRALRDRLGPAGTLVVPAFTYSFCRGEEFDVRATPSTVGSLTEFVRSREGVVRSAEPIFSIAAVGACSEDITRIRKPVCFGEGSAFELLEQQGVQFLLLGIDYRKSLTYFLHLEKLYGVPYREDKLFRGTLVDADGKRREAAFTYYVRHEAGSVKMDYNRVGFQFDRTPDCRLQEFAYGQHRLFGAEALKRFTFQCLRRDPYCLTVIPGQEPAPVGSECTAQL